MRVLVRAGRYERTSGETQKCDDGLVKLSKTQRCSSPRGMPRRSSSASDSLDRSSYWVAAAHEAAQTARTSAICAATRSIRSAPDQLPALIGFLAKPFATVDIARLREVVDWWSVGERAHQGRMRLGVPFWPEKTIRKRAGLSPRFRPLCQV